MKRIKLLLTAIVLLGTLFTAKATHYMGGEITWECIPAGQPDAGKFVFVMKVYRECYTTNGGSAAPFNATQTINSNSPAGNFTVTRLQGWPKDISPACNISTAFSHITCVGMSAGAANMGAVQEHIYKSNPIQISGVPPVTGWTFSWNGCCRNPCTNVPNAGSLNWYLRANMFPYQNTNTFPCFDNSPTFAEVPRTVIGAGYPFTYNHNAYDKELNELEFAWGQPMTAANNPIVFGVGYSYNSPLPGPTQNPNNVAATIDPGTGNISFTSYTTGAYVTSTKVTAFRCGVKVAEIWRDMQVVLLPATSNAPPTVTAPFPGNLFRDTVYAGEHVSFALNAQDFQFLPNGSPQTMNITASGLQFGSFVPPVGTQVATYSTTAGCLSSNSVPPAPCAQLTPAPGPGYPLSNIFGIQTQFDWTTDCAHLATDIGCGVFSNVYNFVLKVSDDFCPAPAINIATITIVVKAKPSLPSPDLNCIKVLPNGDVTLDWSVPIDTMGAFDSYHVFSSPNPNGPFVLLDSITDRTLTTYTHTGANGQNIPLYYYVSTHSGCPGNILAAPADTFATMNMSVFNAMNGTAQLSWNSASTPLINSSTGVYEVYREYPLGVWSMIGSTTTNAYIDSITACGDFISYKVHIADTGLVDSNGVSHSCYSISSIDADSFADIIPPSIPIIDSVSVNNTTGTVDIAWDRNSWGDTEGYVIYLNVNGAMTPIDSVWGDTTTTYNDAAHNPCMAGGKFRTYAVAAIDSCGNISPYSKRHNTINLVAVKDICDDKITLTWNEYNNMPGGLISYDIFSSENGGPSQILATNLPGDSVFEHTGLSNNSEYCYFIRANGPAGITSSSCVVCELANKPSQPNFAYIRSATVIPGNMAGINVRLYTDTAALVSFYRLERSLDNSNWTSIATLPPNFTDPNINYVDAGALVTQAPYFYRFIVVDSCNVDAITSPVASSMHLRVNANDSLFNQLTWTTYRGYNGNPTSYEVFRSVDGLWDPSPIISLPANQRTYRDDVSTYRLSGGTFEYYVNANEGLGNVYNLLDTSRSNSVGVVQKPRLYVPSAFYPGSSQLENAIFYPRGVYINSMDYLFIVYNRWGEKVFESNVVDLGWNGYFDGGEAPQGVYTYYIKFTTSSGILFEDRGTVTLIR